MKKDERTKRMNIHKLVIAAGLGLTSDDQPICYMSFDRANKLQ